MADIELKQLQTCQNCGSPNLDPLPDGKTYKCRNCGTVYERTSNLTDEENINLTTATTKRLNGHFEEALEIYDGILSTNRTSQEANWGALLAEYGIIHETGDKGDEYVPTCHLYNERPIPRSTYYRYLTEKRKAEADELEKLRLDIGEEVKKEKPYDVFICYKKNESKVKPGDPDILTREAHWGEEIYNALTYQMGLRVFFSQKTLEEGNINWEPMIYAALRSAKLMLVLTSSKEHVESPWVKNEWSRYCRFINSGEKDKVIRVLYDESAMSAYDLPKALSKTQAINHEGGEWLANVRIAAEKACRARPTIARVEVGTEKYEMVDRVETTIEEIRFEKFTRGKIDVGEKGALQDAREKLQSNSSRRFDSAARDYREIIAANRACSEAYWMLMLCELKCTNDEEFIRNEHPFDDAMKPNLESAIASASADQRLSYFNTIEKKIRAHKDAGLFYEYIRIPGVKEDNAMVLTREMLDYAIKEGDPALFDAAVQKITDSKEYVDFNLRFAKIIQDQPSLHPENYYRNILEKVDKGHETAMLQYFLLKNQIRTAPDMVHYGAQHEEELQELYRFGYNPTASAYFFKACTDPAVLGDSANHADAAVLVDFLCHHVTKDTCAKYLDKYIDCMIQCGNFVVAERFNNDFLSLNPNNHEAHFNQLMIRNKTSNALSFAEYEDILDDEDFDRASKSFRKEHPSAKNMYTQVVDKLEEVHRLCEEGKVPLPSVVKAVPCLNPEDVLACIESVKKAIEDIHKEEEKREQERHRKQQHRVERRRTKRRTSICILQILAFVAVIVALLPKFGILTIDALQGASPLLAILSMALAVVSAIANSFYDRDVEILEYSSAMDFLILAISGTYLLPPAFMLIGVAAMAAIGIVSTIVLKEYDRGYCFNAFAGVAFIGYYFMNAERENFWFLPLIPILLFLIPEFIFQYKECDDCETTRVPMAIGNLLLAFTVLSVLDGSFFDLMRLDYAATLRNALLILPLIWYAKDDGSHEGLHFATVVASVAFIRDAVCAGFVAFSVMFGDAAAISAVYQDYMPVLLVYLCVMLFGAALIAVYQFIASDREMSPVLVTFSWILFGIISVLALVFLAKVACSIFACTPSEVWDLSDMTGTPILETGGEIPEDSGIWLAGPLVAHIINLLACVTLAIGFFGTADENTYDEVLDLGDRIDNAVGIMQILSFVLTFVALIPRLGLFELSVLGSLSPTLAIIAMICAAISAVVNAITDRETEILDYSSAMDFFVLAICSTYLLPQSFMLIAVGVMVAICVISSIIEQEFDRGYCFNALAGVVFIAYYLMTHVAEAVEFFGDDVFDTEPSWFLPLLPVAIFAGVGFIFQHFECDDGDSIQVPMSIGHLLLAFTVIAVLDGSFFDFMRLDYAATLRNALLILPLIGYAADDGSTDGLHYATSVASIVFLRDAICAGLVAYNVMFGDVEAVYEVYYDYMPILLVYLCVLLFAAALMSVYQFIAADAEMSPVLVVFAWILFIVTCILSVLFFAKLAGSFFCCSPSEGCNLDDPNYMPIIEDSCSGPEEGIIWWMGLLLSHAVNFLSFVTLAIGFFGVKDDDTLEDIFDSL